MASYFSNITVELDQLKSILWEFIKDLRINYFENDPYSGVFIHAPKYYYDENLTPEKRAQQIEIRTAFLDIKSHLIFLSESLPDDLQKELNDALGNLENEVELNPRFALEGSQAKNAARIKILFSEISDIIAPFGIQQSQKILIPDTNALIKSPDLVDYRQIAGEIKKFSIFILPTVLSELDKLKQSSNREEFRKKVESVISRIKGLRKQGSMLKGVTVDKSIIVRMIAPEPNFQNNLPWLNSKNADDRIIASTLEIQRAHSSSFVLLVTSDINLQNKAEMAKIPYSEPPNKMKS